MTEDKEQEMIPDKVIITCTAEGTNVSVFSGKKELSNSRERKIKCMR